MKLCTNLFSSRIPKGHLMDYVNQCLSLYIGCDTNRGKFIGIIDNSLLIRSEDKQVSEYDVNLLGHTIFLYLRFLSDLTNEQRKNLIEKGMSIGRPSGYSFSNYGFLYLLSLSVDLFGLIDSGLAKDIKAI